MNMTTKLDDRQISTLLAALRTLQAEGYSDNVREIATNGGEHEEMDDLEIDELCERINTCDVLIDEGSAPSTVCAKSEAAQVKLSDEDIGLIVHALRQHQKGKVDLTFDQIDRLCDRLEKGMSS